MKDEDYVDEMLKIGDCGDCCPEGALTPLSILDEGYPEWRNAKLARGLERMAKRQMENMKRLNDNPEIVDQIKEMDVIPTYGGSK